MGKEFFMHTNDTPVIHKDSYRSYNFHTKKPTNIRYKKKNIFVVPLMIIFVMLVLNALSWMNTDFSDFYVKHIYPIFNSSITRLTGLAPFSIGEILIIIGIMVVVFLPVVFIVLMIVCKRKRRKVARITACFLVWVFTYILTTETLNCFINYHCSTISDTYYSDCKEHNSDDLAELGKIVVEGANYYSQKVSRDADGQIIVPSNLNTLTKDAMLNISDTYPMLKGYYPDAKPIVFSGFMTQANTTGVYFPFTLESNYNNIMYGSNYGDVICHEYSHLKGYM